MSVLILEQQRSRIFYRRSICADFLIIFREMKEKKRVGDEGVKRRRCRRKKETKLIVEDGEGHRTWKIRSSEM